MTTTCAAEEPDEPTRTPLGDDDGDAEGCDPPVEMLGVREYRDGRPVELGRTPITGRLVVVAVPDDGYCCTEVDLLDLIAWLHRNRPDLLEPRFDEADIPPLDGDPA